MPKRRSAFSRFNTNVNAIKTPYFCPAPFRSPGYQLLSSHRAGIKSELRGELHACREAKRVWIEHRIERIHELWYGTITLKVVAWLLTLRLRLVALQLLLVEQVLVHLVLR